MRNYEMRELDFYDLSQGEIARFWDSMSYINRRECVAPYIEVAKHFDPELLLSCAAISCFKNIPNYLSMTEAQELVHALVLRLNPPSEVQPEEMIVLRKNLRLMTK